MADEIKRVIEVDASASTKTVRQLQAEIAKLHAQLQTLKQDTAEYAAVQQQEAIARQQLNQAMEITNQQATVELKTMEELNATIDSLLGARGDLIQQMVQEQTVLEGVSKERKALNEAIKAGRITEEDAIATKERLLEIETTYKTSLAQTRQALAASEKQVQAAIGSYNEMSLTLARLRSAYRQLSAEVRESSMGKEMLEQIQALDKKLKDADASMGNYQRNVGNYDSIVKKLLPSQAQFIVELGEMATKAGGVPALFKGIGSAIAGATKAALAFIATPLGFVVTAVAAGAALLVKNWDKVKESLSRVTPLERAQQQLAATDEAIQKIEEDAKKAAIALQKQYIEALRAAGSSAEEIAAAQRQFNDSIDALNVETLKEKVAEYKKDVDGLTTDIEHYNTIVAEQSKELEGATAESAGFIISQIKAARKAQESLAEPLQEAIKKWEDAEAELTAETMRQEEKKAAARKKASQDAGTAAKNAAEERIKAEKETAQETEKILAETLKIQQNLRAETEENEIKKAKENYERDLDNFNKTVKEKRISAEVADSYRIALAEQTLKDIEEIRKKYRDKEADELAKELEEEQKQATQREQIALGTFNSNMADLDRNAERESLTAEQTITDPKELEQELRNIQQRLYESKIGLIDEMLQDEELSLDAIVELSNQRADLEIANSKRVLKNEKKDAEESKKVQKLKQQVALDAAQSTLTSLSSILGEETAAGKAAAVAAATIDTFKAANGAYASLAEVPLVGPALGATAAAAAIIAGIANVKKILSTSEDGSNASSVISSGVAAPTIVTPPAVVQEVPVIRSLTGASEEEQLNQASEGERVYVVYSDIEGAGRTVEVQQSETTF